MNAPPKKPTARERILEVLTDHPDGLTKRELIRRLGLERGHARGLFASMQVAGEITIEKVRQDGSIAHVCRIRRRDAAA